MRIAILLSLVGVTILTYSLLLSPYKDEKAFRDRYMAMSVGQNEEYSKLRDEMLTPKYDLQDYGVTLITVAVCILIITRNIFTKAPKTRLAVVILAIVLPFLTIGGFAFDLFQGNARGEFPHWADSLGIPLMGIPIQFIVFLFWSLIHLLFLRNYYAPSAPLALAVSREANLWLLFISGLTVILISLCVVYAEYWYAIPGVFWLYLYLSLAAGRLVAKRTQQKVPAYAAEPRR
jgi:hypothetical protein